MKYVFDALIVAMLALFIASCFTLQLYLHIMHLLPLCLGYGIAEIVMVAAKARHEDEFGVDPTEAVRHRFCMVLYMHGITVADWRVAGALLAYAILARFAKERGVVIVVHSLGMIAMALATMFAQPRGIVAWAPVITLVAIFTFVIWIDREPGEARR